MRTERPCAADWLANSDLDIGEVARRAGYTTAEAFGRAFKQSYGLTPGAYREGVDWIEQHHTTSLKKRLTATTEST